MASYRFCFRPSGRKGGHAGRLYLRVVHGSQSRSVTTAYRVWPGEWDAAGSRLIVPYSVGHRDGGSGSFKGRNGIGGAYDSERGRQLAEIENNMNCDLGRMEAVIRELEREGAYMVDDIMARYRGVMTGNSVGAYAEKLAAELELSGQERTARAYRSAAARFRKFNGGCDVNLEQINAVLVGAFQQALKSEGKSANTISFYMRTLRVIYNKAVADGRIPRRIESPFSGVYTGVSPTRKLALSPDDLARLSEFDPTAAEMASKPDLPEHLRQALAMFLFCYHARGMCFVDLANLKKSNLRGDTIRYRRRKTGQQIEVKVHSSMRKILDYFAPMTAGSEYLFPIITDRRKAARLQYESGLRLQNQRLKRIAAVTGIRKRFSTHCSRHSNLSF